MENQIRKGALIVLGVMLSFQISAQEFKTYDNGYIYSEATMSKLENIVDSLNLKFKTCDLNKSFNSKAQAIGHRIRLSGKRSVEAKQDIQNKISFDDFVTKYRKAKIEKNVLIVKYSYTNYQGDVKVVFDEINVDGEYGAKITRDNEDHPYDQKMKGTWLFEFYEKSEYSDGSISAFYFPEEFKSIPLSSKYNTQIGYSDCLIDTVNTKFTKDAKPGSVDLPKNWQKLSIKKKEKLLKEMRSTRVIGGCSQDTRPRRHAINIALLSAETINWEVFLKSHLDIMNDRFDRVSDGSYAWAARKTYIKELEELNIDVLDLLIGISLRVENPSQNHYYGSIGRLGRAITESIYKERFEQEILSMIEDNELDDYNRVIAFWLFLSYNNYLEEEDERKANLAVLEKSIEKLPVYLSERIELKER